MFSTWEHSLALCTPPTVLGTVRISKQKFTGTGNIRAKRGYQRDLVQILPSMEMEAKTYKRLLVCPKLHNQPGARPGGLSPITQSLLPISEQSCWCSDLPGNTCNTGSPSGSPWPTGSSRRTSQSSPSLASLGFVGKRPAMEPLPHISFGTRAQWFRLGGYMLVSSYKMKNISSM